MDDAPELSTKGYDSLGGVAKLANSERYKNVMQVMQCTLPKCFVRTLNV